MKKTNKLYIIMLIAFICSLFIKGDALSTIYFTYHLEYYLQGASSFVISFVNYLSIHLIFACGLFEIYNIKHLAKVFLLIQPAKLIIDLAAGFAYQFFGIQIFYPCSVIFLTIILIYLADSYLRDKSTFKEDVKKNTKELVKAVVICVAADLIAYAVSAVTNSFILSLAYTVTDETKLMNIVVCCLIINFAVMLCLTIAGIIILTKSFKKLHTPEPNENAKAIKFVLFGITIALLVISSVYFVKNSVNLIVYYLSF